MKRHQSAPFASLAQWWQQQQNATDDEQAMLAAALGDLVSQSPVATSDLLQCLLVLQELNVDVLGLAGAVAYHRVLVGRDGEAVLDDLPSEVAQLARELIEIERLEVAHKPDPSRRENHSAEGLRRLLLALVKDVRVVLIALAHRLVRLRAMTEADEATRSAYAQLIQAIHAPVANRLGIWQIKWELEDLIFRFLQPDTYQRVARLLDERRTDRERYITELVADVDQRISDTGIKADIAGRPKHIFSIWRKMQRKGLAFEELFDVRAIRVLVDDIAQCYTVLGLVHSLWRPVPGEFDDYIANPKPNMYQSLHTAVFGPEGKPVEVQIRTHQMHEHAELGVAAHWRYKEGGQHDAVYQRKLNWMRQVLQSSNTDDGLELLDELGQLDDEGRIYVLTPKGDVLDLRRGSTVLDFAYQVHTDVGHRCRGAKVNGRIVPLTYQLENGEQVEILTAKNADPSRDWLVPSLGYLASPRSRNKVRQWFRKADYDRNVVDGKELLERELKRLAAQSGELLPIAERYNFKNVDALYAALAIGEVTPAQVATALQAQRPAPEQDEQDLLPLKPASTAPRGKDDITIDGVGNLMTTMAKCCNPVPGDRIVGYITRTRGVSIHREDCKSLERVLKNDPDRLIAVDWGGDTRGLYQAEVFVLAFDRKGLIRDVGQAVSNCRNNLVSVNTHTDATSGQAEMRLTVQVADFEQLGHLLRQLQVVPNVLEVRRIG